jgi:hemoglobin/transferrin/lactoferrin receptor protein
VVVLALAIGSQASAAEVHGKVTDRTGAVLRAAVVRLLNVATGQEVIGTSDDAGMYRFRDLRVGIYRVATSFTGFSESARTIVFETEADTETVDFELELGSLKTDVTVTAMRGERDTVDVPLRTDTIVADTVRELAPASTGDVLAAAPGVTVVGSGPFQIRPRLRGLDSTRVLVLVDGERLNNARTATDRAGIEVGLIDVDSIQNIEVLGGAGSVLYGTDALSGTINIVTDRARLSDVRKITAGFDGFYSTNEKGRRGTVNLGFSDARWAISFRGGQERFDDYRAGKDFHESTQSFLDNGTVKRIDDFDDAFGVLLGFPKLRAFPDPFNAPFTRTSSTIPNSSMSGSTASVSAVAALSDTQRIEAKYQRRHASDIGFPDFAQPFFFQGITTPFSNFDKFSATYTLTNPTPWLARLSITPYYQRQDRLLHNDTPAQFAVPTGGSFFPINMRFRQVLSDTRQQVWTPGVDVQAALLTHPTNVLTVGATIFQDRSEDERTTTRINSEVGNVNVNQFFVPIATIYAAPIPLPTTVEHPVRVPDATFRDAGFFAQDEWSAASILRLTGGVRVDSYRVVTRATPGYDVATLVAGAKPAIDPATLPDINGVTVSRNAFTGEAGAVLFPERPVSLFTHYGRSYRHPNLEELLFSGPATAGNIVPNITVKPETGHNVDVGAQFRSARFGGSAAYFNNTYDNFISTEITAAITTQEGNSSISQAINLAKVRIQGFEAEGSAPIVAGGLNWLPTVSLAYTRGTVLGGTSPLSGTSLAGQPQDNITPLKVSAGLRVNDRRERWWASYGVRAQSEVKRVSPLLTGSPFLIPQDLLALDGFGVHRVAFGYDWRRGTERLGLTIAVDNLTDTFYREHFQFAPARGRSVSLMVTVKGAK